MHWHTRAQTHTHIFSGGVVPFFLLWQEMQAHVLPDPPDRAELTSQSFPGLYQGIPVPLCVQACGVNTVKVCVLGHIDDNYSYWKKITFPFLCQWLSLWWLTCVENSSKHQRLLTWHTCTLCSANASWFATHLHPSYQVVEIILLSWYLFIFYFSMLYSCLLCPSLTLILTIFSASNHWNIHLSAQCERQ